LSKGPGAFQRRVLTELQAADGLLPWAELRQRFPRQAEDRSLHRAVRSLKRMGYVEEHKLRGERWIDLCATGFWSEADRELLRLATTAVRMVRTLAAARGVNPPGLEDLRATLNAYKRTPR
jgi:hypothetical protein